MNSNFYKIIFSKRLGALVAVGEHTACAGKAASGQASRVAAPPSSFTGGVMDTFVGALKLTFASVSLVSMSLGTTQAQSTLPSMTLPQSGHVNQGAAAISSNGAQMGIIQTSDKASINWQSFNIGTGASVRVQQPNSSSVLLNRVTGNDPSQILGKLSANGQLILLNPNGIMFGKDGSVTASAFTASTFGLTDADFMNGFYKYNRSTSTAAVVNQGTIEVSSGGFVALIGATVTNEGRIIAPQGDVVLAAAESVTLPDAFVTPKPSSTPNTISVRMSNRVRLELDPAAINTAVNNTPSGVIITEGGQVLLQAAALSSAVASVTHSGLIDTSAAQAGAVTVLAENGVIQVDGGVKANSSGNTHGTANRGGDITIGRDEETGALSKTTDVSAAKLESQKGFVETSGEHLIVDGIQVKAGEWLLDPTDITITSADSGMASSGTNPITQTPNTTGTTASTVSATTLANSLRDGTSVIVKTTNASGTGNGDITVASNIAVTGSADATLTLQAERDIVVNSNVSIARTGTNKLNVVLNSDLDGNGSGAIVMKSGSSISSNGGSVTLGGGTGGAGLGSAMGSSVNGHGIYLNGSAITTGTGDVTLTGTSFNSGSSIWGVAMENATISTTSGNVNITATGRTNGMYGYGMMIRFGAAKITTSTGNVTINATSSANGSSDAVGIQLRTPGAVTTSGGNISITGTSRGASGSYNQGIGFNGGSLIAGGSGSVTLVGVGGSAGTGAIGVGGANITTAGGAVNITGTSSSTGAGTSAIDTTGSSISTSGGNLTFTGDSYSGGSTEIINAGIGSVTIQNRTAGTRINLGGADVLSGTPLTLGLSSAELSRITASTLVIGQTGPIASGDVTVSTSINPTLAKNLKVLSGGNITLNANATITTLTNGSVLLNSDSDGDGSGAIVLNTGSGITSNGGNITLGGGSAGDGSGNAVGNSTNIHGISLTSASLSAAGGNISLKGQSGAVTTPSNVDGPSGIYMVSGGSIATTGAGTISMIGTGAGTSTASTSTGVHIVGASGNVSTVTGGTTGSVTITGTGTSSATGNYEDGVMLGYATVTSTGGNVNVTGTGGNSGTGGTNKGVSIETGAEVSATGAGTVTITGSATLGGTAVAIDNGATIKSDATTTITANATGSGASIASSGANTYDATGGLTVDINNAGELTGVITGGIANAGGLTKIGTGTLMLTGGNTYGGTTTISAGTLQIGNGSNTGTLGTGAVSVATNSNLNFYRSDLLNATNTMSGSGNINFLGTGTLAQSDYQLTGNNSSFSGNITLTSSRLGITSASRVGTAAITVNSGAGLYLNGGFTLNNTLSLAGNGWNEPYWFYLGALRLSSAANYGGAITLTADARIGAHNSTGTVSGVISGSKNLEFNTPGDTYSSIVTLTNNNTYAGATTINSGTLQIGTGATAGSIASSSAITDNGTLIIKHSNAVNLSQSITGTGGLTQAGAGTTTLTGTNAYGVTTISAGTLQVGNAGASGTLGTGAVTLSNNANLNFVRGAATTISDNISGTGNVSSSITGSGNDLAVSGTINLTNGLINLASDGNISVTSAISTSNTSSSAVILNAGKGASAGTSAGGDLIFSGAGAISVGSGGRATLMSGSITGSTGLATLVGTGNSRYNSDELSTGYTQAIGSSGLYAIYRESPSLTITLNNDSKTYNALAYSGGNGYTVSNTVNSDTAGSMGGTLVYGGTAQNNAINAGTYSITGSGLTNSLTSLGYTLAYSAGTLTVGKASLTATAHSGSTSYNGYNQTLSGYTVSGLLGSDTSSGLSGISASVTAKNAGSYTNTITVADQPNYTVTGVNGSLTIAKVALTATGNSGSVTYNGANQSVSGFTVSELKGADRVADLSGISASGVTAKIAGTYTNAMTVVDQANYTVTGVDGTLAIGKAALIATANSASVTYNGLNQSVSGFTVAGFKGTDTMADLAGLNAASATGKNFGTYTNNMAVVDQINYTVAGVNGVLSVGKANLTLSGTRAYDGTTSFAGSNLTAIGVNNETFSITGAGSTTNLHSKNVQSNIPLNSITGLALGTSSNGGVGANYNALSSSGSGVSVTPKLATVTAPTTTLTYNGATQQQNAETTSGFVAGDNIAITGLASGKNANTYASNLAVSGTDADNYNITLNNANLVIDKAALVVTAAQTTKIYDGNVSATGSGTLGTLAGSANGNTLNDSGSQSFLDKNVGANKTVRASGVSIKDSSNADVTNNYNITYIDNTTSSINKAALTVKANDDARFVTLADATGYNGVSYVGFVGGETNSVLGGTLSISRTNANTNVSAQNYTGTLVPTGLTSNNYNISYVNGDYTIVPAGALLIKTTNETLTYGTATPSFSTTARYLDGSNVIHTLSQTGSANNYTFSDGAGGSVALQLKPYANTNVAATSTSGNTVVGTFDIKDMNPIIVGRNFTGAPVFVGIETVNTQSVTPNATNVSKVYDGNTAMNNVVVGFTGGVANDNLFISGTGFFSQKNVGQNLNFTISGMGLSGSDASNYTLSGGSNSFTGTNGIITPASLVISSSDVSKVYDRSTAASGHAIATQGTQVFGTDALSGGTFTFTDMNVGNYNKTVTVSGVTVSDGNNGANYVVSYANNTHSTITPKALTASFTAANKTYDGNSTASVTGASSDILAGDTVNVSNTSANFDTKNAGTGKTVSVAGIGISGSDTGNYSLQNTSTTTVADITKKDVTLTAGNVSKTYDGTWVYNTTASDITPLTAQLVGGDTVTSALISYANKNAGNGNKTITLDNVTLNDGNNGGNYNVNLRGNTTSTITPAPLTIRVNNTGMFVTQDADTATDQGFSYTGFKNGETATTALSGGALTLTDRVYTGVTNFPVAGTYTGVYGLNSGLTSSNGNYTITVQKGDLTVTPADKLLITIASQSEAYGSRTAVNLGKTTASTVTAEYCLAANNCNGSNLVSLSTTQLSGTQWKATDNTGSFVVFDTSTLTPSYSNGGFLNTGNYALSATEIQPLSLPNGNFTGRATNGGVLTITPRAVITRASAVSKTYDGSTQQFGADVAIDNAASHDVVTLTANTSVYASKDVGSGIAVTLNALALSGSDAGNYDLPVNSMTTMGAITPKTLTLVGSRAANKVFDSNTNATVTSVGTLQGLVGSETLGLASVQGLFDSPAAGTNKVVAISAVLQDGSQGGLANNYTLAPSATFADITMPNDGSSNIVPPKPLMPMSNNNSSTRSGHGSGSGGGAYGTNPYAVTPNTRNDISDHCNADALEACACEAQDASAVEGVAVCYQPQKAARN